MDYHLLLGGPENLLPEQIQAKDSDRFVGVDYGTIRLLNAGYTPFLAVGDFDSVNRKEMRLIEEALPKDRIIVAPSEKDQTDTELAIQHVLEREDANRIFLYGSTGGRMDHMLSLLNLPLKDEFRPHLAKFVIVDKFNTLTYYQPGSYTIEKEEDKFYVAFGGLTGVDHLKLWNLKYTLDDYSNPYPFMFSSNEFIDQPGNFSFESGVVVVIQSKD